MWYSWIAANWAALTEGQKLFAPSGLGHPSARGFRRLDAALPMGQVADWTLPCSDGSRIHVHEFADGHLQVHRDVHDPDRGGFHLVQHLLFETPLGFLAAFACIAALARR